MPEIDQSLRKNIRLLYVVRFLESAYFHDAIYVLFGVQFLHLSYFQAGSLFFIGWFVSIFLDFWGGIVADTIGRKRAQIIGLGLHTLAYVPYLFTKSYELLIIASIVEGISWALTSNSLDALIYEQAVEAKAEKLYKRLNAFSQIWLFMGIALASLIGAAAYLLNPRLPYALMIIALLLALVAAVRISVPEKVETVVAQEDRTEVKRSNLALKTFRRHRGLAYFVIVSFFAGVVGDMLFSYYQPYYIKLDVSALTLGLLFFVIRLTSGAGSYLMHRLPDRVSPQTIQLLTILSGLATTILLLVLKLPLVLLAPLFSAVGGGFIEPNMRQYINQHAENKARAASLSVGSGIMNFGVGVGFVVSFYLADKFSSLAILKVILIGTVITVGLSLGSRLIIEDEPVKAAAE